MRDPRTIWDHYRQSVYGRGQLAPAQEKECSNAFFAGLMAGINEVGLLTDNGATDTENARTVQQFLDKLKFVALVQNPTGKN